MIRRLKRLFYSHCLTRVCTEMAAARERREELDRDYWGYVDYREEPPESLDEERDEVRESMVSLGEEYDYLIAKLAAL